MSALSKKVLEILQADFANSSFIASELVSKGFSQLEIASAIRELEENGYIHAQKTYISGTIAYSLS